MASQRTVNLNALTELGSPSAFIDVSPNAKAKLAGKAEVEERVCGCLRFCWHVVYDPNAGDATNRRKYLRAALAEFASLDDAAQFDLGSAAPKMLSLDDPAIHVVRLLRHANVHLAASTLHGSQTPAIWQGPDGEQEFDYPLYVVPDIDAGIRSVRDAGKYSVSDLSAMIAWIDREQKKWGIQNVVIRAAERFLDRLP